MAKGYAGGIYGGMRVPGMREGGGGAPDINAIMQGWVDRTSWQYYDTLTLAPGTTVVNQYSFFQTPLNSPDPYNGNQSKTRTQTNLKQSGSQGFNPPYDFVLKQIGFVVNTDARLYDITQLFKHSFFQFTILDKVFFEGNLVFHPAGVGITGNSTQTSESSYVSGIAAPNYTRRFGDYAKYIAPLMSFNLTIYFPQTINQYYNSVLTAQQTYQGQSGSALPTFMTANNGGNGISLIAFMDGLADRAVQ